MDRRGSDRTTRASSRPLPGSSEAGAAPGAPRRPAPDRRPPVAQERKADRANAAGSSWRRIEERVRYCPACPDAIAWPQTSRGKLRHLSERPVLVPCREVHEGLGAEKDEVPHGEAGDVAVSVRSATIQSRADRDLLRAHGHDDPGPREE